MDQTANESACLSAHVSDSHQQADQGPANCPGMLHFIRSHWLDSDASSGLAASVKVGEGQAEGYVQQ